jgi:3'(2'), 5'-bisphosphate nucleotidase
VSAGRRLVELRASNPAGASPDELRKAGDQLAHEFLIGELVRLHPHDAVLSEEGRDDPMRLDADRVWIVDPLDGTREFGEPGRTDWAVHVALWERGELTAGAVALPARGLVLSTADPTGGDPTGGDPTAGDPTAGDLTAGDLTVGDGTTAGPLAEPDPAGGQSVPTGLRLLVSRSRPPAFVQRLAADLGAELVPMGSAGAKAAAVIRAEADAYVHAGGQYEWDSAAPVAVARAAGLHASRIDGSPLAYNQADVSIPDILISPAWLAPRLLAAIADASAALAAEPEPSRPSTPSDSEPPS